MKSSLDFYKEFENKTVSAYEYGLALQAYTSIDGFIQNPTDEEYNTIYSACYEAYMKSETSIWVRLVDGVAEGYSKNKFTLDELKSMDKWDILELEKCGY